MTDFKEELDKPPQTKEGEEKKEEEKKKEEIIYDESDWNYYFAPA